MLISLIVVCNDSDITWILAEHMITERITIDMGSRRVRPNQINFYRWRIGSNVYFRESLPCGYINGSRRLMARVAQKRMILDVKSTPLSTTDDITDKEWEITAATILTMSKH